MTQDQCAQRRRATGSALALAIGLCAAALAGNAQAEEGAPTTPIAKGTDTSIADIVVTARKRAEPLQRTPLAVSALTSEQIEAKAPQNITDLGGSMPNVRIDSLGSQGRAGMLAIRGVNYARSDQAGDPSTAFYIDGLYQPRSTLNVLDMFDIESVEVLRGPQGTLFGRNAFAGAVNIQSKRPTQEFGGQVEGRIGNYGRWETRAAVNVPIVQDVLAMRASLLVTKSDGYYHSIQENGKPLGGDDNITGRISLLYTPSPDWNIFFKYEHVRDRSQPTPAQNASTTPAMASSALPAQLFGSIAGDPPNLYNYPRYWTNVNIRPGQDSFVNQDNVALNITRNIEGGSINLITGYQYSSDALFTDPVGGKIAYLTNYYRTQLKNFSQEVRGIKELNKTFQLLVGAYYAHDDLTYGNITYSEYAPLTAANSQTNVMQKRDSWAVFGELEVRPMRNVRLNFGGREMGETKDFYFAYQSRDPTTVAAAVGLSPGVFLQVGPYGEAKKSWTNFSPKISVDWRPTSEMMLYASWTKGFKSGGFSAISTSLAGAGPYDPERIETWEAGLKSFWFHHRLKANITLFWNNLSDLQRSVNFINSQGQSSNNVFNAASAVTKGVELELEARLTRGLNITGSAGFLDAHYKSFCAAGFSATQILGQPTAQVCNTTTGALDWSGIPLYNAPKFQGSIGVDYKLDLHHGEAVRFNSELNYTSSLFTNDTPWPISMRRPMVVVDAGLRWNSKGDRYYAAFNVKNLFNRIDTQQAIRASSILTVFNYTAPRTYVATLGVKF
ncbi:MAG TPA: TonB-dependent receptor [Novosphingobium sp.]|nr:TonB-dependent receptor [Novosphingobium sp.]